MTKFAIDFTLSEPSWGHVELDADDKDQAEMFARDYVNDTYDGATDVEFSKIEEIV